MGVAGFDIGVVRSGEVMEEGAAEGDGDSSGGCVGSAEIRTAGLERRRSETGRGNDGGCW